jgi:hypothetical protein
VVEAEMATTAKSKRNLTGDSKIKKTFATVSYLLLHLYTLLENQINVRKFWPPYLLISSFFFYDPIKRAADS